MAAIWSVMTFLDGGFIDEAWAEAREWCGEVGLFDDARVRSDMEQICAHLADDLSPKALSLLCLLGGVLVERGADPTALSVAMLAPLSKSLAAATRLLDLVALYPNSKDASTFIGRRGVSRKSLKAIRSKDPEALDAYESLDRWSSPFAAVFAARASELAALRERPDIAAPLGALHGYLEGASCMYQLLHTPMNAPLIVLAPALGEGGRFEVSGCVNMGQLTVLLSDPMASIFERLGADGRASDAMLDNARGLGPQQIDDSYCAGVHFYSWMAVDPATGEPAPGRHTWEASGAQGNHSLPPDLLVSDLPSLDGVRVLVVVGRDSMRGGVGFTRSLGGVRTFGALRASLRPLPFDGGDARRWLGRVREACSGG